MKLAVVCVCLTVPLAACSSVTTSYSSLDTRSETGVKAMVTEKAKEHGIPPKLAHGIVRVESNYNCRAKNPHSSATGIGQVIKGTAREVGVTGDLKDCRTGLEATMRYLKLALAKAKGNLQRAATLYNQGINSLSGDGSYARKVMSYVGIG